MVLAGLWGLTDHTAAYHNENLLQMNLLALPLLWLVTRLILGSARAAKPAAVLAAGVAAISLIGLLLKPFPQFCQVNGAIIALALPAHAGIAAGVWRLARLQDPRTRRSPARASG
jgi:low temperature requirement protein LtrA